MKLTEVSPEVPFVHRRDIRFGETDAARIVYTVRFFDYAIDAIDAWYERVVGVSLYTLNTAHGLSCPFVHASIDFESTLRPGNSLATTVLVSRRGRSSLSFATIGRHADGRTSFTGTFTIVFISLDTMKSISIPAGIAERIDAYRQGCETAADPHLTRA